MKTEEIKVVGNATTIVFAPENDQDRAAMERMCQALSLCPWISWVGLSPVFISKLEPGRLYICVESPSFPKSIGEIMSGGKLRVAFREPS